MRRLMWLVLSLFSSFTFAQVTDLASLQSQLAKHSLVRGEFTQLRHIAMFEQPLLSTGQFLLDKNSGLLWQQSSPFPVNLVLTKDKLRQTFANHPPQTITEKENPMAFYFSHLFLSLFHGDTQQLKEQFEMEFNIDNGKWYLALTPKNPPLSSVFATIIINGSSDIDALSLQEVRGDKTDIQFTKQSHQPETLTDVEQAQFNF